MGNPVFNNLRQVYITSCDGHFLCVYLHTFSCYRHFMYGGHSISRGRRLSVRQDDLLTVDIWHWILKLQRRTQYRPLSFFFILFIKLILWPWMIALHFFYTDKKWTLKKKRTNKMLENNDQIYGEIITTKPSALLTIYQKTR